MKAFKSSVLDFSSILLCSNFKFYFKYLSKSNQCFNVRGFILILNWKLIKTFICFRFSLCRSSLCCFHGICRNISSTTYNLSSFIFERNETLWKAFSLLQLSYVCLLIILRKYLLSSHNVFHLFTHKSFNFCSYP